MNNSPLNTVIIEDDPVSRKILHNLLDKIDGLTLRKSFSEAFEAYNYLKDNNVDLVFLDIELPDMNGIELLSGLKKKPEVIVVSGHTDYAFDAFQLDVVDYIPKPINKGRFLRAIEKVMKRFDKIENQKTNSFHTATDKTYTYLKKKGAYKKVAFDDILWVESDGDYMNITTGEESFYVKATIKEIQDSLPEGKFIRIHRSYVVPIGKIDAYNKKDSTVTIGKETIPVSNTYRSDLVNSLQI